MSYSGDSSPINLNRKLGYIRSTTPDKSQKEIQNIEKHLDEVLPQIEIHMHTLKEISTKLKQPYTYTQRDVNKYLNTTQQNNKVLPFSPLRTPVHSPKYCTPLYSPSRQIETYNSTNVNNYTQKCSYNINEDDKTFSTYVKRISQLERNLKHKENIINQYTAFIQKTLSKYEALVEENVKLKKQYQMINEKQLNKNTSDNKFINYNDNRSKQHLNVNRNSNKQLESFTFNNSNNFVNNNNEKQQNLQDNTEQRIFQH